MLKCEKEIIFHFHFHHGENRIETRMSNETLHMLLSRRINYNKNKYILFHFILLIIPILYSHFAIKHHLLPITDARSCVTCDKVLAELEKIDDDTDSFGVDFVKINDKRLAKQYGIKNFPALTYFR